jgi:hypothetical protein
MSCFGRRSLYNWDYYNTDYGMWERTTLPLQLKILNKWYPTDSQFSSKNGKHPTNHNYIILEYRQINSIYIFTIKESDGSKTHFAHPLDIIPSKEYLRDWKINKILE